MTEHRELVLRIERTFDAPIEAVFDAWTSEEVLRRWIHAGPDWETPTAAVDLRVGGKLRIVMRDPAAGADHNASGEYTLVDPPNRVAFTWTWDHLPDSPMLIELELSERGGVTTVRMTNSGLPNEEERDEHEDGWGKCYDNLDRVLAA